MSIINQVPLLPSDPGVVDRGSQAFPNKGDKLEGVGGGMCTLRTLKFRQQWKIAEQTEQTAALVKLQIRKIYLHQDTHFKRIYHIQTHTEIIAGSTVLAHRCKNVPSGGAWIACLPQDMSLGRLQRKNKNSNLSVLLQIDIYSPHANTQITNVMCRNSGVEYEPYV